MLTMSDPPLAAAQAPQLNLAQAWGEPDAANPGGSHVWPLRRDWAAIVQAALALGPLTLRAGDGVCHIVKRGLLLMKGLATRDICPAADTALDLDCSGWACGMATQSHLNDGRVRRGFAFFDDMGQTVLRLDLDAGASPDAFHEIVRRYSQGVAHPGLLESSGPGQLAGRCKPRCEFACRLTRTSMASAGMDGRLQRSVEAELAEPLAGDAVLDVLRHARRARLPMTASFSCRGLNIEWTGLLLELTGRAGLVTASGVDMRLQWCQSRPGPQAWLVRKPTSFGLVQSLALQAPDGELRLLLRPAPDGARLQPCAWRAAIDAAIGGPCGCAC